MGLTTLVASILFPLVILLVTSCGGSEDDVPGIDRSALYGTWTGNDYECLFDKPRAVELVITKGQDPLGLKINLNNGEHVIDADYGQGNNTKSFVGDYTNSSYSITISGQLYDDGVMKLAVFLNDDVCDATLTKK
jgi:hypothetical protein